MKRGGERDTKLVFGMEFLKLSTKANARIAVSYMNTDTNRILKMTQFKEALEEFKRVCDKHDLFTLEDYMTICEALQQADAQSVDVEGLKKELTDEWLGDVGFKYTQEERQPTKHWHLTLGWGAPNCRSCIEDLNIEVASGAMHGDWFCWLRRGTRFSNNFVHVRHIKYRHELEDLITALTGTKWKPENCMCGNFYNDEIAAKLRKEREEIPQPLESGGE